MNTPFISSIPLWFVAIAFSRCNNDTNDLQYSIDYTPVLALRNDNFSSTHALIAHYEYPAPIWVQPSADEYSRLDDLINGRLDDHEAIFVSHIVTQKPIDDSNHPLADIATHEGLLLYCDDRLDAFSRTDELHDQQFAWVGTSPV